MPPYSVNEDVFFPPKALSFSSLPQLEEYGCDFDVMMNGASKSLGVFSNTSGTKYVGDINENSNAPSKPGGVLSKYGGPKVTLSVVCSKMVYCQNAKCYQSKQIFYFLDRPHLYSFHTLHHQHIHQL